MNKAERGEALKALVEDLKGKPCVYGQDDCSLICAQWIADVTGRSFDWPVYSSREDAEHIIEESGGLVAVWTPIARQLGLEERHLYPGEAPEIGDVGIIETSQGAVGGIFLTNGMFLWRAEKGVRVIGVRAYVERRDGDTTFRKPIILKVWAV